MKKKFLIFILYYSGILWVKLLWQKIFGNRRLKILTYHRVLDVDLNDFELSDDVIDATLSDFDKQMRFVSRHFNAITFKELAESHKNGKLPKNPLIITFDDGYGDNFTNAYPILKRYGLPAVMFLATAYIGTNKLFWWDKLAYLFKKTLKREISVSINGHIKRYDLSDNNKKQEAIRDLRNLFKKVDEKEREDILRQLESSLNVSIDPSVGNDLYLSWEDVIKMSQNGIEFGAHTEKHLIFSNLSIDEVKKEIISSIKEIEQRISKPVEVFAYPGGVYNKQCLEVLKEIGIKFGCAYTKGRNDLSKHPYELKRINVDIGQSMIMFKVKLFFPELIG